MDQFLLQNAALYQALVKKCTHTPVGRVATDAPATTTSPDMVVSARIRPLPVQDIATGFPCAVFPRSTEPGVVDIHELYNHPRGRPILKSSNYQVDKLFDSQATTEQIYEDLLVDLVPFAWNGGIGTLFAYGQTGSGKTFTVSRLEQLCVESLMDGNRAGQRDVYITIVDLKGNSAFDLLNLRKPISVLEDAFGVTQLVGAKEHLVQNRSEVVDLIERAASFRRTAPTQKNDASSRSHGICRIRIKDLSTNSDGFLYLVDLAGSEAARDIAVHGADLMRETREINISLSVLKDCIRGKVQSDALVLSGGPKSKQKRPHVPFRSSTLTKVLKHVFDPAGSQACKTVIIACVNPSLADAGPSKNTLRYAEMLRVLVPKTDKVEPNPVAPATLSNAQLKDWITKNSGTPPILSAILAPTESGAQLLRLPATEFERRCLKSPGVSLEQAKAFLSKIWKMHVDSQRVRSQLEEPDTVLGRLTLKSRASSRDLDPDTAALPFKERILPGMVISWKPPPSPSSISEVKDDLYLAVILCPAEAVRPAAKDALRNMAGSSNSGAIDSNFDPADTARQYLCSLVTPGQMAQTYELKLWQQVVIDEDMMDREVFLEYDSGTRYYYISV